MLNRESLITELIKIEGEGMSESGSEITDLRRQLRGLTLTILAKRFTDKRREKGLPPIDPYTLGEAA